MKPELRILFVDVASTDPLCDAIAKRSAGLEGTVDAAPGCHVSVERCGGSRYAVKPFKVQVHATAIDGQAVVAQGEHQNCAQAVDSAFDIAQWQLAERAAMQWSTGPQAVHR